jgi:hypothetical protein
MRATIAVTMPCIRSLKDATLTPCYESGCKNVYGVQDSQSYEDMRNETANRVDPTGSPIWIGASRLLKD